MSDILTRLLLNTGDYDTKLAKAKKSSGDFASEIGGKVAGMVGKFAAGIGVAMGGVEAFQRVLNSTQTSGDLMRGTMQSLKTSVDEFFYSVNKGNLHRKQKRRMVLWTNLETHKYHTECLEQRIVLLSQKLNIWRKTNLLLHQYVRVRLLIGQMPS